MSEAFEVGRRYVRGSASWYPVDETEDGRVLSTCKGYRWKGRCKHVDAYRREEFATATQFVVWFGDEMLTGDVWMNVSDRVIELVSREGFAVERMLTALLGMPVRIQQVIDVPTGATLIAELVPERSV